eukprot:s2072_g18.t1
MNRWRRVIAAESSTGTNVNVCTTDDFTKSVDALVYYIDPDNEEMKIRMGWDDKLALLYDGPSVNVQDMWRILGRGTTNGGLVGNQVFCQMNECIPEVVKAMRACVKETGSSKLFSANITADDPEEMIARGKYIMSQFGPLSENCCILRLGQERLNVCTTVCFANVGFSL